MAGDGQHRERVPAGESFGEMRLWLSSLDNALSRMPTTRAAIEAGVVTPMLPWGSMATAAVGEPGLAYLTQRPADDGRYEIGAIGHAPVGHKIAERMAHEVTVWDESYRTCRVDFALYPRPNPAPTPESGRFVLQRPSARLVATWRQ